MQSHASTHRAFAVTMGITVLVFAKTLWTLARFSLMSEQYSHIVLIPLVSGVLLYQERGRSFRSLIPDRKWAVSFIGLGAATYGLSWLVGEAVSKNDRLTLESLALVLIWLGVFLLFYGREAFRSAMFPLCFLFLIVPFPEAALGTIIRGLQLASAEVTAWLFQLAGIPFFREDTVFALPGVTIEVARECSGIRSTLSLFITALVASHLFLRSWGNKLWLYLAVFPITVFKNGLRILGLSAYAVYVDSAILDSTAHRRGGIPFFGLALLFLGAVLWFLRRREARAAAKAN